MSEGQAENRKLEKTALEAFNEGLRASEQAARRSGVIEAGHGRYHILAPPGTGPLQVIETGHGIRFCLSVSKRLNEAGRRFLRDGGRRASAYLGTRYHGNMIEMYRTLFRALGRKEGFDNYTINKAIRGGAGQLVRVYDEGRKRKMISIPDLVDYRRDFIIDHKLKFIREEDFTLDNPTEPEVRRWIPKRDHAQYKRYALAYNPATGRIPIISVQVFFEQT